MQSSHVLRRAGVLGLCAGAGFAWSSSAASAQQVTAQWLAPVSGSWIDATKWSTPQFPNNGNPAGTTYHAVIDAAGAAHTVSAATAVAIDQLTLNSSDATLQLTGAALTLHASSAVLAGVLHLAGGALEGAGDLTVWSDLLFTGGAIRGGGGSLIIAEAGTVTIGMSGSKRIERPVENYGYVLWNSQNTLTLDAADFQNHGLFEVHRASGTSQAFDGDFFPLSLFTNTGTYLKTGAGAVEFDIRLNNEGFVLASEGRLELEGAGDHSGEFLVGAGAILDLRGGHILRQESILHGAGEARVRGQSVEHFGLTDVAKLSFIGGSANFHNDVRTSSIRVSGGSAAFLGGLTLTPEAALTVLSGTLSISSDGATFASGSISGGVVTGGADLAFTTALDWTGGRMSGAGRTVVQSGAALELSGGTGKLLHRTLENHGEAVWTSGLLRLTNAALLNEGVFTADSSDGLLTSWGDGGVNTFDNRGEFVKIGAGTAQFIVDLVGVRFENSGSVDVREGALRLAGSASTANGGAMRAGHDGRVEVVGQFSSGAGAAMEFEVGGMKERGLSGLMTVTGGATLAGTLSVETPEMFEAMWGDRWVVMTYGSVEGDIDVFALPTEGFASRSDEFGAADLRWYAERGETEYAVGVSHVADIDHDGLIGFADLNVIASNFNAFGSWAEGDVDGDGFVGFTDLNVVLSLFNVSAPSSVPAPGAVALLAMAGLADGRRRRG